MRWHKPPRPATFRAALGLALVVSGLALAAPAGSRAIERVYTSWTGAAEWQELESIPQTFSPDDPVARLSIPSLDFAENVLSGATKKHLALSPAIARRQPMVILAHRDTHFNPLKHLQRGAEVNLQLPGETRLYTVTDIEIHTQETLAARLDGIQDPTTLLLVTCYPFHYFGPAPRRFLAICELQRSYKP